MSNLVSNLSIFGASGTLFYDYDICSLLWILLLITIPSPIIVANMDEPPYDMIGSGEPTIGSNPNTIDILTVI